MQGVREQKLEAYRVYDESFCDDDNAAVRDFNKFLIGRIRI